MPGSYNQFANARDYELGCPVGEWLAQLDHKAWGKNSNMILYFTELGTGAKYWLSVFWNDGYKTRDGVFDFRNVQPGSFFVLTTTHSARSGKPVFQSAKTLEIEEIELSETLKDLYRQKAEALARAI